MTLILKTESHGEVESGFYGAFTQFTRLGEYTFATRHFCELAQHIAERSNIKGGKILGYNLDKFWQKRSDYMGELIQMIIEAEESYLPELQKYEMDKKLEREQGEISLEDEVDLYDEGRMIPVIVSNNESYINIGKYKISGLHFGRMAVYLANGGFIGWINEQKPEFAEATIEAIRNSKRGLYKEVRKELQ